MENFSEQSCLNCDKLFSQDFKHCPHCGRSAKYKNLSIGFILKSFLESFLNFDVKVLHSFRDIWIPNKITKMFLSGKRDYHVHPFRFYFIVLVIFFFLLAIVTKNTEVVDGDINKQVSQYEHFLSLDTLNIEGFEDCSRDIIDSLKSQIPNSIRRLGRDTLFKGEFLGSDWRQYGITYYDAYTMNIEDFDAKYKIENKLDKYALHQILRIIQDSESAVRFGIGNMLWGILLLTALMAFVLWVFYARHKSYFVEHLLHISNFHCVNIILLSLCLILAIIWKGKWIMPYIIATFPISAVYLFVSLYKYYNNNVFKTLFKMFILFFAYTIGFTLILFIIGLTTVAIF